MNQSSTLHIIVGLGKTGLSCARYLKQRNIPIAIVDNRQEPPGLQELRQVMPDVPVYLGDFRETILTSAAVLVVSPGVSLKEPVLAKCIARGIPAIGDIELFARQAKAPIVAITGSNAKSTVTTLVGKMAQCAGHHVCVGGNIGIPALELLSEDKPDLYVLELSSFQLETTQSLQAAAATILNISVDHMDRYSALAEYIHAKQRIYPHCHVAVYNRDDPQTTPHCSTKKTISFGLSEPHDNGLGLRHVANQFYLAQGETLLLPTQQLRIKGRHNWSNALAALALGSALQFPMPAMLSALQHFSGLPHRCQWLADHHGVKWYNDSKGTNVGATIAAIEGLGADIQGKLILIAGGIGKGADFSPLYTPVAKYVKTLVLIGQDAPQLAQTLGNATQILHAGSMKNAIYLAAEAAHHGDAVLLSPACASFDMFRDFEHRGEVFANLVKDITTS